MRGKHVKVENPPKFPDESVYTPSNIAEIEDVKEEAASFANAVLSSHNDPLPKRNEVSVRVFFEEEKDEEGSGLKAKYEVEAPYQFAPPEVRGMSHINDETMVSFFDFFREFEPSEIEIDYDNENGRVKVVMGFPVMLSLKINRYEEEE